MSSVASGVTTLVNDLANGLISLFDAFAAALVQYAPVIVTIVITVAIVAGLATALRRIPIFDRLLRWIGL